MRNHALKPVALAAGLLLALPAFSAGIDFSGSNIYMKFLDGDQRTISNASGDTASGADQGQWTEFELRMKVNISKQVEAGVRLQSRSPASYWTNFGFANNEGFGDPNNIYPQQSKYIKLRGAYVLLTPGYAWLDQALIGSSDWGMFDPFTIGQVRYIDRDNYNGLYFKGKLPLAGSSWEFGRLSLPNYLQANYGQGASCCSSDASQYNEAVYVAQAKAQFGPARLSTSYQWFDDHQLKPDSTPNDGRDEEVFAKNKVFMLKGEGSVMDGFDVKGAYYYSQYDAPLFDQPWINGPKSSVDDHAFKIDVALSSLAPGLSLNYQYFDIGAGYFSNAASRRETDVLLTEGSESSWYGWGKSSTSIWLGGAAKDYQQAPSSAKCNAGGGGVCRADSGLKEGANGLVDNDYMDFDEAPAESVQGWKGHTFLAGYEIAKISLGGEYSRISYNYNWQNYSATGPLSNFFNLNNDRKTDILVLKAGYIVPVAGGIELTAKYKMVDDTNSGQANNATDDRDTKDTGYTFAAGNQLFGDLYGKLAWGKYKRDITKSGSKIENDKSITSLGLAYNLAGFEVGLLTQWVSGDGDPNETGTKGDIEQYRMKAFVKAIF
ncbi:MAG: hypothetical protein IPI51_13565 [Betaproteobacteria bacterium]|nr:hypothetical protein [Betaproteobacteria bacterium]